MSIITFYSYKGGVGRTMALANVAVLLARKHRVLVVDWDLEAPGIERYFTELGIRAEGQGLLPLLTDVAARRRPAYRDYTCEVTAPDDGITLRLLPSGREADPEYYRRLESFEWAAFYRSRGGDYLERLRGQWLSDFDFVLIDSRTGLSDAGGVCTILLPDIVVAMFTPAHQSLYGVRDVMRLAQQARHRLAYDRGALSVVPVASRVDRTHPLYADWRTRFASELGEFPSAWLPRDADLAVVLDRLAIGYEPGVSHGERLVALSSDLEVAQLRSSYERLATLLAGDLADLSPVIGAPPPDPRPRATLRSLRPSGPRSSQSAREAAWRLNRTAAAAATTKAADYEWDVFVSYPRTPHVTVWLSEQLLPRLQGSMASTLDPVPKIFMDRAEVATAERWAAAQRSVLARSRVMLAIVSPYYFRSTWCRAELETFRLRSAITGQPLIAVSALHGSAIHERALLSQLKEQFTVVDLSDLLVLEGGVQNAIQRLAEVPLHGAEGASALATSGRSGDLQRIIDFHERVRQLRDVLVDRLRAAPPFDPTWPVVEPDAAAPVKIKDNVRRPGGHREPEDRRRGQKRPASRRRVPVRAVRDPGR